MVVVVVVERRTDFWSTDQVFIRWLVTCHRTDQIIEGPYVDPTADRLADFPVAKGTNLTYCVTHRGPPLTRSSAVRYRPVRTAVLDGKANFPLPQNHPTAALGIHAEI
jgi:hypothetical protein